MKKMLIFNCFSAIVLITNLSCDRKFDEPPVYQDPAISVDISIRQLKAMHKTAGSFDSVKADHVISGIIIANDKTGNIFKSIILQDTSGGISIKLDGSNLYTSYPVGRKIFVRLKNLVISDYGGLLQVGAGIDISDPSRPSLAAIPSNLFDKYLVKGSVGNEVKAKTIDVTQLGTSMQDDYLNTLIKLDNFEFGLNDTAKTYADPNRLVSAVSFTLHNCSGNAIILRNSSYSPLAGLSVPNGNGSITAIYSIYNGTRQLIIRDTSDVQMLTPRCAVFEEDFEKTNAGDITITNWKNIAEKGGVIFKIASFSNNKYAQVSGFGASGSPAVITSWLISNPIDLTGYTTPLLSFGTVDGYDNGATLKAFISTDYNGSNNPSSFNWQPLNANISTGHSSSYASDFLSSGGIDLSSYSGKTIRIGFRYDGANPTAAAGKKTTTYEVDDVRITKN